MKSKKPLDHYQEHICKIWFDEKGNHSATELLSDVIRCKDCEGYDEGICHWWYDALEVPSDGYCYRAERKEE